MYFSIDGYPAASMIELTSPAIGIRVAPPTRTVWNCAPRANAAYAASDMRMQPGRSPPFFVEYSSSHVSSCAIRSVAGSDHSAGAVNDSAASRPKSSFRMKLCWFAMALPVWITWPRVFSLRSAIDHAARRIAHSTDLRTWSSGRRRRAFWVRSSIGWLLLIATNSISVEPTTSEEMISGAALYAR